MAKEKEYSPMMQKYLATKEQYKDCLLFYRLGDFYEMFFDDAVVASKVLDLVLSGRSCGMEERAPMCGVPYHAVDGYVAKLLEKGYKVAICDQLSEPKKNAIVDRDVTRVITPGTVIESEILGETRSNYILSVCKEENVFGVAYCEVSTGEFKVAEYEDKKGFLDLLSRLRPAEILCNEDAFNFGETNDVQSLDFLPRFSRQIDYEFDYQNALDSIKKQFNISNVKGHDFANLKQAIRASGALLNYLFDTQKRSLNHINKIITEKQNEYMHLDYNACKNLELVENARDKKRKGTLFERLNNTKTSMGARLLEKWILQPLQDPKKINERLDCVEELYSSQMLNNDIMTALSKINDIARICSKISYGTILPKDCVSLKDSLFSVVDLSSLTKDLKTEKFKTMLLHIDDIKSLAELLESVFLQDCPAILSGGGFIREDFNKELYDLKHSSQTAKKRLSELEAREREATGIKNLKVGYSRVFGYFIEVNKSQENLVPYNYERRQTISGHERFVTEELREIENSILNSDELAIKLEQKIFDEIKVRLKSLVEIIQQTADEVAFIDVVCSLAKVAQDSSYVRPKISRNYKSIKIENGRHPIIEANLKRDMFVPNDTLLDENENRTLIITGPNMAGKSTYMRQIALITIMAHIGSFVPATSAEISIVDRVFTRIGASDDLNNGQSTFMVEMVEVANILNNATNKSLVILDEVGRGTATYDGMSIAWAVLEYISQKIKCKTLFSTHYHEITTLEGKLEGVKNYRVSVKEFNGSVIFLRKIVRGSADRSFGIEVASLSGIYDEIIKRAKNILSQLEKNSVKFEIKSNDEASKQLSMEAKNNIINQIKNIEINKISPMDAFEILINLNKQVNLE